MKQFTHYNADGSLVLDFTGDRRWLVEPKGEELHLTPLAGPVAEAGSAPHTSTTPDANARPIVIKFDKPGSLSALAVGADRVRHNLTEVARIQEEYKSDMAQLANLQEQTAKLTAMLQQKYGK